MLLIDSPSKKLMMEDGQLHESSQPHRLGIGYEGHWNEDKQLDIS